MLDRLPPMQEEDRSQCSASPSKKHEVSDLTPRHRKAASTGGGRAWTEEEESFLLRTRNSKMPYKHIAAHLQKTELACRLHYHQMTFGNNRRRRTSSSSARNSTSMIPNPDPSNRVGSGGFRTLPGNSPPSTPILAAYSPGANKKNGRRCQKDDCDDSNSIHSSENGLTGISHPPMEFGKMLRLDTAFAIPADVHCRQKPKIDVARLRSIYAANRLAFWSCVASQYSVDQYISPSQLEQAFFSEHKDNACLESSILPTPNATPKVSPDPSYSAPVLTAVDYGFSAINRTPILNTALSAPSPARCTVSALLNEPLC